MDAGTRRLCHSGRLALGDVPSKVAGKLILGSLSVQRFHSISPWRWQQPVLLGMPSPRPLLQEINPKTWPTIDRWLGQGLKPSPISEMTACRRMLRISSKSIPEELDTNARLLNDIQQRKLRYFGHVVRADNLCTSILHGRIAGTRKRGRPRRRWTDDIKDWSELPMAECMRTAQDRTAWRAKVSLALAFDPQEWGRTSPVLSL